MTLMVNQLTGFGSAGVAGTTSTFSDCVNIIATGTKSLSGGYASTTGVTKFLTGALGAAGSTCRVTVQGPPSGGAAFVFSQMWIGQVATSGNAYNFDGGQVQILFAGAAGATVAVAGTLVSDEIAFVITQSKPIVVAWQVPAVSSNIVICSGLSTNFVTYLGPAGEAGTTLKTAGYTGSSGQAYTPFRIEVA